MDKNEAKIIVDKQAAHLKANGHFAGLAPGINGAFLHRAERILAGKEEENAPPKTPNVRTPDGLSEGKPTFEDPVVGPVIDNHGQKPRKFGVAPRPVVEGDDAPDLGAPAEPAEESEEDAPVEGDDAPKSRRGRGRSR